MLKSPVEGEIGAQAEQRQLPGQVGYHRSITTTVRADCGTPRSSPAGSSSHLAGVSGSVATTSRRTTEPSPSTSQLAAVAYRNEIEASPELNAKKVAPSLAVPR